MSLHPDTLKIIFDNEMKFSTNVFESIKKIIDLIQNYSALSDASFLIQKYNVELSNVFLPTGDVKWTPIRNIARIIGKIASLEIEDKITEIKISSMNCGCDYFEGILEIKTDNQKISGAYKWQWTSFPERERSYKQFTVFPDKKVTLDTEISVEMSSDR